jgi:hypothetical protein
MATHYNLSPCRNHYGIICCQTITNFCTLSGRFLFANVISFVALIVYQSRLQLQQRHRGLLERRAAGSIQLSLPTRPGERLRPSHLHRQTTARRRIRLAVTLRQAACDRYAISGRHRCADGGTGYALTAEALIPGNRATGTNLVLSRSFTFTLTICSRTP